MRELLKKTLLAAIGLICFGAGVYLTIQANIGVAPWDALNLGLSKTFGILYGTASVGVSVILILIGPAAERAYWHRDDTGRCACRQDG